MASIFGAIKICLIIKNKLLTNHFEVFLDFETGIGIFQHCMYNAFLTAFQYHRVQFPKKYFCNLIFSGYYMKYKNDQCKFFILKIA